MHWKIIAPAAAAAMLIAAPVAASAHENASGLKLGTFLSTHSTMGLHLGSVLGVRADDDASTTANVERDERDHGRDVRHATSSAIVASTTAARITAQANRVIRVSDLMAGFSSTLASRIASSSLTASGAADAQAKLGDFNANVSDAQAQAQAALGLANELNASTTASTTVDLSAQARTDLKSAREFLRAAIEDVRHILGLIFKA